MQAVSRPVARTSAFLGRTLIIICALALSFAAPARAQSEELVYDPQKQVYLVADAPLPGSEALADRLRRLEHETSLRFVVVVVRDAGPSPMRRLLALRERWEHQATEPQQPGFERDRTFLVMLATEQPKDHVVVAAPAMIADKLGLTLRAIDRLVADRWRPRPNMASAVDDMVRSLAGAVQDLEAKLLTQAQRRIGVREDLRKQIAGDVAIVSDRLTELELHAADLRAEGLGVAAAETKLGELRIGLAEALAEHAEAPEQLVAALAQTKLALGDIEASLSALERQRREGGTRLAHARTDLAATTLIITERGEAAPPQARDLLARAGKALGAAETALGGGDPAAAAAQLGQAEADLAAAHGLLEAPPPARRSPVELLSVLAGLVGIALVALVGGAARHIARRDAARDRLAGLRGAAAGLADSLEHELVGLRTRFLRASRPGPVAVPQELGASRPPARELAGESAMHLARARAAIDDLHRSLRQLRQALVHAQVLELAGQPPEIVVLPLERTPAGKLPARAIRETAHHLEKLEHSPGACAERLVEGADALRRGAALVEDVLQEGQSPQPFEDDLADLLERSHEAALLAPRDPVGAAHVAGEARTALERLEQRVARTLELARGAESLRGKLDGLGVAPNAPGPSDLPSIVTWAWHLADEVVHDLDEGARDEATRELDRALGLARDAELLQKGVGARPDAELELLREELHQARLAVDEMRREFVTEAWDDAEVAMLRGAARIELIAEKLRAGGRVPRLAARLSSVRAATLLATTRLLSLRGERERGLGLLEVLEGRSRAVDNYLERERPAVTDGTRAAWAAAKAELARIGVVGRQEKSPPAWDRLLVDLGGVEDALDRVRTRAGDEALRLRRVVALAQGLEKALREAEDVVRRVNPGSPGAPRRLDAARRSLELARRALARIAEGAPVPQSGEGPAPATPSADMADGVDLRVLVPQLQSGLRACRDAREMAAPRILRVGLGDGLEGDARHALLLARSALGRAHRPFVHGAIADPADVRKLVDDAEAALEGGDSARALQVACEAIEKGDEVAAAAHAKEQAAAEAAADARAVDAREAARARHDLLRRARKDELHRRTRFEVLVLGEAETAQADGEDIDSGDDDDELAALEEVTGPAGDPLPAMEAPSAADVAATAAAEAARRAEVEATRRAEAEAARRAEAERVEAERAEARRAEAEARAAEVEARNAAILAASRAFLRGPATDEDEAPTEIDEVPAELDEASAEVDAASTEVDGAPIILDAPAATPAVDGASPSNGARSPDASGASGAGADASAAGATSP